MTQFVLRYGHGELRLESGDLVVGRDSDCDLRIADGLVSRRHAVLHVEETRVVVEDLGSRNGVVVQGTRISGPVELGHGDALLLGEQKLIIEEMGRHSRPRVDTAQVRFPRSERQTVKRDPAPAPPTSEEPSSAVATNIAYGDDVLLREVRDCLQRGDYDQASGTMSILTRRLVAAAERARHTGDELVRDTTGALITLARATGETAWLERLFELQRMYRRLLEPAEIDDLHEALTDLRPGESKGFEAYLERLRDLESGLPLQDRARLRRIEGLARNMG